MTRKQKRLALIGSALAVFSLAVGLALFSLRDSVVFFFTPSEVAAKSVKPGTRVRMGGLIKAGSIEKSSERSIRFVITDGTGEIPVSYQGLVPDLFKEGQGVVAEGSYSGPANFVADSVLAKHDEKYISRELADSLKSKGLWKENQGAAK